MKPLSKKDNKKKIWLSLFKYFQLKIYNCEGFYYLILEENTENPAYKIVNQTKKCNIYFYEHRLTKPEGYSKLEPGEETPFAWELPLS